MKMRATTRPPQHQSGSPCSFQLACLWIAAICTTLAGTVGAAIAQTPDADELARFEREVRPLLIAACGSCHGAKKQESGLRVDSRAALVRGGDSGPAILPGDPARSLLFQAVKYEHEIKMPPDRKLRSDQIAALERWIKAGAVWPAEQVANAIRGGPLTEQERRFWAFQPLQHAVPPEIQQNSLANSPLDRFVVVEWERQKLRSAGLADRRTLLRRVTLDLTGLPPTPDEIAEFLGDESPDAWVRVVDRLLASPAYGERSGRHWLDVVRYADTAGDGADYPVREAYLYRNYVIRSLNADKPYGQFLREQIAGDILAREAAERGEISQEQYGDQVTATGFLAISKRFGYNITPEFQHLDIADAIEGLGRSVLGLSIGCARCHDHKYDPINMADYYSLYGIFASSQFSFPGGEEYKRPHQLAPLVPPTEAARREAEKQAKLTAFDEQLKRLADERAQWITKLPGGVSSPTLQFEDQPIGKPPQKPWFQAGPVLVLAESQSPFTDLVPRGTRGVRLESGEPHDGLRHEAKPGFAKAGRVYFNIDFCNRAARPETATTDTPGAYRFYLGQGAIASLAWEASVTADSLHLRDGATFRKIAGIELNQWHSLRLEIDLATAKYSGQIGKPGAWTKFENLALAPGWNGTIDTFFCDGVGQVSGLRPTRDLDNLFLQSTPLPNRDNSPPLSDNERERIQERVAAIDAELAAKKAERDAEAKRTLYPVAYAVSEGKPTNARIQKRGEPDRPGDEATRRNLEILGAHPISTPDKTSGRRDLAEWLSSPQQALTWRVIANRIWQQHFGAGIVATASDFGTRGELPSHPELLDFLAQRLLQSEGSLKTLHRELVLMRSYRLASIDDPENLEADPRNRWLWKRSRKPLDAESIRDGMLATSGDLNRAMPGAHPFPPTESWGFTIHYPFSAHYDSAHRSAYLMVQRARKHPYLSLFDGADPNLSTSERLATTTPTQALYLMNDPFVHARAESLAKRALREQTDETERVRWLTELVTGRELSASEAASAREFVSRYRDAFRTRMASGMGPSGDADVAAWAALSRVLLTSNAYLFVD